MPPNVDLLATVQSTTVGVRRARALVLYAATVGLAGVIGALAGGPGSLFLILGHSPPRRCEALVVGRAIQSRSPSRSPHAHACWGSEVNPNPRPPSAARPQQA
jgi:hypothetical protein